MLACPLSSPFFEGSTMLNSIPAHVYWRDAACNQSPLDRIDRDKHCNDVLSESRTELKRFTVWRKLEATFSILVHCQRGADSGMIHIVLESRKSRHTKALGVAQLN